LSLKSGKFQSLSVLKASLFGPARLSALTGAEADLRQTGSDIEISVQRAYLDTAPERGLQAASMSKRKRTKRLILRLATLKRRKRRAPRGL
jgi:hypothetical protein